MADIMEAHLSISDRDTLYCIADKCESWGHGDWALLLREIAIAGATLTTWKQLRGGEADTPSSDSPTP
jgi:hypothetical protein